jgi:ubiquinone/menaquinone biosynthesis C-methylase UbiE/acyl carrier protein
MNGSYQLSSFTENQEAEVLRLKAQVELFFDKEFESFQKFGLRDGMKIIECGSGPGYLILNILKRLPQCEAYALEIDPFLFKVLDRNSELLGNKIYTPIPGSIYNIDLPDESVDFAVTRLVIEHLQEPMKAFSELRRILKPDGILVVVSNDFAYHVLTYPVITELHEMFDAYNRSRFSEGGNPLVGRQLPVFFEKAGFKNIEIETTTAHSRLKGDKAMLSAENVNISRSLVKEGFLEAETLERLLQKWVAMLKNPDHVIYRQLFLVGGRKNKEVTPVFDFEKDLTWRNEPMDSSTNVDKKSERGVNISSEPSFSKNILTASEKNQIEDQILVVWKQVLLNDQISKSDNFFEIGGNSVMIPEILQILDNKYNIKLKILDFFQLPTVLLLASAASLKRNNEEEGEQQNIISETSNRYNQTLDTENTLAKIKAQRNKFKNLHK